MASIVFNLFVVCLCLSVVAAYPNKKDTVVKKATIASTVSPKFTKCNTQCPDTYTPLCGKEGTKTITFGNKCVYEKYLCERGSTGLTIETPQGECKNPSSVRLQ